MKIKIKEWYSVIIMCFIWLLALLYGSGIGQTLDVYGKTSIAVIVLVVGYVLASRSYEKLVSKKIIALFIYIIAVNIFTSIAYGKEMWDYVWLYLLIPFIGLFPVKETPMKLISLIYGGLGMAVLYLVNYGSVFKGWNENSIAIIAFFSFAVLIMAFNNLKNIFAMAFLLFYAFMYYQWTDVLNSRGGVLFAAIMLLCVLNIIPAKKILKSRYSIIIILLIPLVIALIIGFLVPPSAVRSLDLWSYKVFDKPIFNGRDVLWRKGFEQWLKYPLFGSGNLAGNWHNSAVTMLVGGGLVGFCIWIFGTDKILTSAKKYLEDSIVRGLMIGFLTIWLHQTIELGLVHPQANPIPYAMLGLLVGRIRTIKRENGNGASKNINNCSGL